MTSALTTTALTVFDAVQHAARDGLRLSHREYTVDEATERNAPALHGVCWRVLVRPPVEDPADAAERAWMRGDHLGALNLLQGELPTQAALFKMYRELGLTVRTLWAPGAQLTETERYRLHCLRLQARAHFEVAVLDHVQRQMTGTGPIPDLVAYPHRGRVYLLHHTPQGRPDGATLLRHPHLARMVNDHLTQLLDHTVDINLYARPHG